MDVTAARHFQTILLLAKGHEIAEVAATVSFGACRKLWRRPQDGLCPTLVFTLC